MSFPRLAATEFLQALRWPGAAGALLLVACAGWGAGVLLPARDTLAAAQERLTQAERQAAAVRQGVRPAPQTAAARRDQFYAALPASADLAQHIDRIFAAAANEQLSLVHGEYTAIELAGTRLVRYKVVLPLKGTYGQLRRFAAASAAAVPALALDDVSLQRQSVEEPQVEARLQLSIYLARP